MVAFALKKITSMRQRVMVFVQMLLTYKMKNKTKEIEIAQQNLNGALHVLRRMLELLIDDKHLIEETIETST